jgi:hypothetical protein
MIALDVVFLDEAYFSRLFRKKRRCKSTEVQKNDAARRKKYVVKGSLMKAPFYIKTLKLQIRAA